MYYGRGVILITYADEHPLLWTRLEVYGMVYN
jgi:hypothetical protein